MRTMLKLSNDKTEVMLFTSKQNAIHMKNVTVCFGDINITSVNTVRNLGVILDSALNMEQQLNNISGLAITNSATLGILGVT